MSAAGPWYISAHAVRRYLRIVGRPETELEFSRAEDELCAMARDTMASARVPKHTDQNVLQYRGPKPLRLQFIVSTKERPEGNLPQLVDVAPAHAGLTRR